MLSPFRISPSDRLTSSDLLPKKVGDAGFLLALNFFCENIYLSASTSGATTVVAIAKTLLPEYMIEVARAESKISVTYTTASACKRVVLFVSPVSKQYQQSSKIEKLSAAESPITQFFKAKSKVK